MMANKHLFDVFNRWYEVECINNNYSAYGLLKLISSAAYSYPYFV